MTSNPCPDAPHCSTAKLALRARDAAKALSISERLLATLVAEKRIPHARINSAVIFPVADLQRWLSEQAAKSHGPTTGCGGEGRHGGGA